jgi:hypothetical protein
MTVGRREVWIWPVAGQPEVLCALGPVQQARPIMGCTPTGELHGVGRGCDGPHEPCLAPSWVGQWPYFGNW